jgi:hypothetical protein
MIALQVAIVGGVLLLAICLAVDWHDRRRGHRPRPAAALENSTMHHRNDDRVIELFVQAATDREWLGPR